MTKKIDIVIEAVRYKNGQILTVRGYERRGATFSDCVLLDRKVILDQIKDKKVFATGQRKELLASTFEIGKPVKLVSHEGREFISTSESTSHDELEGVPAF